MKYVVIGSSAAGINAVKELRRLDKESEIVLISKDKDIYSRCILHHYMEGIRTLEELNFAEKDFAQLYQVNWMKGCEVVSVKADAKVVELADGTSVTYDKLLIASGSHTFVPPIPNLKEANNVIGFRNIEDIETLKEVAKTHKNILVMGAGLVGIDCVSGLLSLGVNVTLVEMAKWMLSKQLDERAAKTYQDAFAAKGVVQYYGDGIAEAKVDDNGNINAIVLASGKEIACDYVVVTAGVRANVEFLADSGIETSRFGLVYDETGKTNNDDIYGAGDVSGMRPIWPVAVKEGIIAASNMAGVPRKMTDFFASKSTMNFMGIPSMSLGDINNTDEDVIVEVKETKDSYKKILHKDGKIVGALLQHDLAYSGILQQLIARRIDVTKIKKPIFDVDYSDFFHINENFEFYYED